MRMPSGVAVPWSSSSLPEVDYVAACGSMPTANQKQICGNYEAMSKEDLTENWQEIPIAIQARCEASAKRQGFALYYTSLDLCIANAVRGSAANVAPPTQPESNQEVEGKPVGPIYPESELEDNKTGFVKTSCRMVRGEHGLWRARECRVLSSAGGQDFINSAAEADARSTWSDDQIAGKIDSNGRMERTHSFSVNQE
ncbi:hypothetical protein [Neoasaia chiangmaiensis]|uniref:hypothetical protein n=1 Tax=Neoasaia chiangmaiensis TaxID=320497 RepID=UPI001B808210|nr:hypothetical protein [Neoasaia chiangmaiensis]